MEHYDVIIIGSGAGGGTMAYALADWGKKILLIERGGFLPKSNDNWSHEAVFGRSLYTTRELWYGGQDQPFRPGTNYYVGGNTKFYGAVLPRFRKEDFSELKHRDGISPAWCVSYDELEPYYNRAEKLYRVHGMRGEDPTEPGRSDNFPHPPISHEPYIQALAENFKSQGLRPHHHHLGIDLNEEDRSLGKCVRCCTCDGFPCLVDGKSDAHVNAVLPALKLGTISLWTNALVKKLHASADGKEVSAIEVERDGKTEMVSASVVIVACGAVNSAVLLLRSANDSHSAGLANSSGLVGRNYMKHHGTVAVAVDPRRRNDVVFQKTIALNDFYLGEPDFDYPLGNIQAIGKLRPAMFKGKAGRIPHSILKYITDHSSDWWLMTEDLPNPNNRVELRRDGRIRISIAYANLEPHHRLIAAFRKIMRKAGYPFFFTWRMGIELTAHQCGTMRFGSDPKRSVLNEWCRTWDVQNLYVVDASFFPSSGAMNPALTVMAMALRVADHIKQLR